MLDIGAVFKIKAGVEGQQQIDRLNASLKTTGEAGGGLGRVFGKLKGALLGAFSVAAVGEFFKAAIGGAMEAEQASARLSATLRATGHSAGMTKKELDDMADSMAESTQFDDESIRNAQAQMLKFGNIQKGVFERGIALSADLAAFMGTDVVSAAQTLGKALASPTEGLGALEKQTGKFKESQRDAIKAMVESGNIAGAQSRILEILTGKLGGTAEAMNTGLTKATHGLKKAWDEMLESIGKTSAISGSGTGVMGILEGELKRIKDIVDNGTWWEKLKAMAAWQSPFARIIGWEPELSKDKGGARYDAGKIGAPRKTEDEEAAAGAAAERRRQVEEAAALRRKTQLEAEAKAVEALKKQQEGAYDSATKGLQNELDNTQQLSEMGKVLLDIERGRFGTLSGPRREAILNAAREVDLAKERKQITEETEKGRAKNLEDMDHEAESARALVEHYKNLADPTREYRMELERIVELWLQGQLSEDEAFSAGDKIKEKIKDLNTLGSTGKDVFQELKDAVEGWGRQASQAFVDWAFGAKTSIKDVAISFMKEIAQMILYKNIFEPLAKAGANWLSSVIPGGFKFAEGGVMGSGGPVPLRKYAGGGIASSPQLAMFGEGSTPEAYVPLPDGRRIPVALRGGGGGGAVSISIPVTVNQTNSGGDGADPRAIGNLVGAKVREVLVSETRAGGLLAGLRG